MLLIDTDTQLGEGTSASVSIGARGEVVDLFLRLSWFLASLRSSRHSLRSQGCLLRLVGLLFRLPLLLLPPPRLFFLCRDPLHSDRIEHDVGIHVLLRISTFDKAGFHKTHNGLTSDFDLLLLA